MDAVAAAAERGAPHGLVIGAERQTEGRGRRGRSWSSPSGAGLYFSYLVRPTRDLGLVTLAAGVAVREGIRLATDVEADLKWPNDVFVDGRKLAGLLAEGARLGTPDVAVTLGVGLNVREAALPPEVADRATWLARESGAPVDRGALLASVLGQLDAIFRRLAEGQADGILRQWRGASPSAHGVSIQWRDGDAIRTGRTAGIDATGALLARTDAGLERIVGGEVVWPFAHPGRSGA
ncbi:MAG: biotin--[acetyl-CoA-carboxylase] ligase [Vicinamibacterales bacterium]